MRPTLKDRIKIQLRTINKHRVHAIPLEKDDPRQPKGGAVIPECYSNIFCLARKKRGKTCAIFKILKECATKHTHIIVFCSTIYKDKNWIAIRKYFKRKKIQLTAYTDLFEDGEDHLGSLINDLNDEARAREEEEDSDEEEMEPTDRLLAMLGAKRKEDEREEEPDPQAKSKYQPLDYIFVFDDLSHQLKNPSIAVVMKKMRHYRCKCILSSQWIHDTDPQERKQLDNWLIFGGLAIEKLKDVHRDADIHIPFEQFWNIYKAVTKPTAKDKFPFLYIDTNNMQFRKNFNQMIEIPETEEE